MTNTLRVTTLIILLIFTLEAFSSSPRYLALADSADNYIKAENWTDAEKTLVKALRLEPGNFSNSLLLSNLGVVQSRQGRMEEALESFRLGISIAPNTSVLYNNRARVYMQISRYEDALLDINKSLEIDSVQEWPLQMRGFLLLDSNPLQAKEDFLLLSKLFPHNHLSMSGLAAIAEKENNYDDAVRYYDESIAIMDDPDIRFSRILLKINHGKYNEASEDITESLQKYPREGDLYLLRGYLHKLRFRYQEAEIDKKIALDKGSDKQLVDKFFP